ncbi:hypothetical protein [Arthrobacter sp. TWP1-1]|uniref:hypothetical protein n=1 Tax=Arthrobacter sp. TWP1-1 TaxID=2804568 RepID=UPI003CF2C1B7
MRTKKFVTSLTIFICTFAAYNFGKYFEAFDGLLFTGILTVVGVIALGRFVESDNSAVKGKTPQP